MDAAITPSRTRTAAAALALACLVVVRMLLGDAAAGAVLDVLLALTACLAMLDAAQRARPGRSRLGWRCQTAAVLLWVLAPLTWLVGLAEPVATTGRVGFVVLTGLGWWFTSLGSDVWSRVRLVIDAGLGAASLFVLGWAVGLRHVWLLEGGGTDGLVAVALPLGAVAVALIAGGLALTEMRPGRRLMPGLQVLGLVVVATSDLAWSAGGTPVWAAGWACVALATRTYTGTSQRREVISTRRALLLYPYLLLAPATATVLVQHLGEGVPTASTVATVVMAGLLLARQHVTLLENRGLVERLGAIQRQLHHQATHDPLTGLASRVVLDQRLEAAAVAGRTAAPAVAMVFIDLDDFKRVNDTLGHGAGDEVLVQTAGRLSEVLAPLGEHAIAIRMGGDEFVALLVGDAAGRVEHTAHRLLEAIGRPMTVAGRSLSIGASVGVAVAGDRPAAGEHEIVVSSLLRASDLAMYDVKRHGKGDVRRAGPTRTPVATPG